MPDTIIIDPEFRSMIPPLTKEERDQLEANIIAAGEITDPVIVWKDHGILLDGHNRKEIGDKHGIPYQVFESETIEDRDAAMVWIYNRQRGRRNMSDLTRIELASKVEPIIARKAKENQRARKGAQPRNQTENTTPENSPELSAIETRVEMAKGAGVSDYTYVAGKRLLEHGVEPLIEMARSGDVGISAARIVSDLPKKEQEKIVAAGPKAVKAKAASKRKKKAKEKAAEPAAVADDDREPWEIDPVVEQKPEPAVDPNRPWAEFEKSIHSIISDLTSARIKLQKALEYDADTKQIRGRWAHFFSATGSIVNLNQYIGYLKESLPCRLDSDKPGYISHAVAKMRNRNADR